MSAHPAISSSTIPLTSGIEEAPQLLLSVNTIFTTSRPPCASPPVPGAKKGQKRFLSLLLNPAETYGTRACKVARDTSPTLKQICRLYIKVVLNVARHSIWAWPVALIAVAR